MNSFKKDTTENYSHAIGEQLGELAGHVNQAKEEYLDEAREYIRQNPYKSIAIAAAAGFALAGLISLLSKKRNND